MEIKTSNGVTVDFEAAVNMIDDELRICAQICALRKSR